jgi:hypothetical protein
MLSKYITFLSGDQPYHRWIKGKWLKVKIKSSLRLINKSPLHEDVWSVGE